MVKETPLISVVIVTHNHEKFIENVVDSVLGQQMNYTYEVQICDDASTDKTQEILSAYARKHPELINLTINEENQGPWKSATTVHKKCIGKYITWLDGDDYWSNNKKLGKQVEFLESNSDYVGCFHDAQIVTMANGNEVPETWSSSQLLNDCDRYSQFNEYRSDFHPWHLLQRNMIPTAALVFRNAEQKELFGDIPEVNLSLNWLLHLNIIKRSKFKYFNETWSIYNDHLEGASKKVPLNDFKEANIAILKQLLTDEYYHRFKKGIYQCITDEYLQILLNPTTMKESKTLYYKASFNYVLNSIRTMIHLMKYNRNN